VKVCEGRVERVTGDYAWVRASARDGCELCAAGRGCGAGLLLRGPGAREGLLRVRRGEVALRVGDTVTIGAPIGRLGQAAWVLYALPAVGLLLGGLTGSSFGGDGPTAAGALLGGALSLIPGWCLEQRARQRGGRSSPGR